MKKTFPLHAAGKADARVLDAIKHDVRKYVKRERAKPLPDFSSRWEFACRVGPDAGTARPVELKSISAAIDEAASAGGDSIYVEVLAAIRRNAPDDAS